MKSRKFDKVKTYYDDGRWSIARVREAVVHEWITADEFKEITGLEYDN